MNNKFDFNQQTIQEWRQLGFFYNLFEENGLPIEWQFFGSRKGLTNFVFILEEYTSNAEVDNISDHIHLGPYNYLKIMTWKYPIITGDYFAGTISDLKILRNLIFEKLNATEVGEMFSIEKDLG